MTRSPTMAYPSIVRQALYRRAIVMLAGMSTLGVACLDLKGPAPYADSADAGTSPPPAVDGEADAPTVLGDAAIPIDPRAKKLASSRKWLADLPKSWLVSKSYVYAVGTSFWRTRPSTAASLGYSFSVGSDVSKIAVTDDFVFVADGTAPRIYDAAKSSSRTNLLKSTSQGGAVALDDGRFAWTETKASPVRLTVRTFQPSSYASVIGEIATEPPRGTIVGQRGDDVFIHEEGSADLRVIHTELGTQATRLLPRADLLRIEGVAGSSTQVLAVFGTPDSPDLELLDENGTKRDLSAEMTQAGGSTPLVERRAIEATTAQSGNWLLYTTARGIFAFDRASPRIVPCQLPQSVGAVVRSPRVVEDHFVVFEVAGGDENVEGKAGLYTLDLGNVLPP